MVKDLDTGELISLTHEQAGRLLKLCSAVTIYSSQSKTLHGNICVTDTRNPRFTSAHLLVALSRAVRADSVLVD